jgi:CRP-like cAMP-binding protein
VLAANRQKTTVSLLRRGQVFGDQALLNNERRSTAVAPTTNTTLLVVNKEVGLAMSMGSVELVSRLCAVPALPMLRPSHPSCAVYLRKLSLTLLSTYTLGS